MIVETLFVHPRLSLIGWVTYKIPSAKERLIHAQWNPLFWSIPKLVSWFTFSNTRNGLELPTCPDDQTTNSRYRLSTKRKWRKHVTLSVVAKPSVPSARQADRCGEENPLSPISPKFWTPFQCDSFGVTLWICEDDTLTRFPAWAWCHPASRIAIFASLARSNPFARKEQHWFYPLHLLIPNTSHHWR